MCPSGEVVAARARGLVGVRFRPQGRDPAVGLDCVGVAGAAAGVAAERLRGDYPMRGGGLGAIEHELRDLGCRPALNHEVAAGDILVLQAGPAQFHLGVHTGSGLVHADASLRKVVERPLPVPWPVIGVWRPADRG